MLLSNQEKLLTTETCRATLAAQQAAGKRVVLCHGVFDLLHPGHIVHLQEARELGDILVVSVTSAPFVNRGPGRPIFSDELRLHTLAALSCVSYVLIASAPTALEIIDVVQPDIYCKGREYADHANDVTRNIGIEEERVASYGGEIRHAGSVIFSSTQLINNHLGGMSPAVKRYAENFLTQHSASQAREGLEKVQDLRVLVIGDVIIDEFMWCQVQGLTSKGRVISTRLLNQEQHLGGSIAIARHIANFTPNVTLAAIMGTEPSMSQLIASKIEPHLALELIKDEGYPTIVKRRYIERQGVRDNITKLLAVSKMDEGALSSNAREQFLNNLERALPNYDLVVVADYGHGLIDVETMNLIQSKAPFLAVNCQTNSANFGYNLITKYHRADTFCLDEQELRLAYSSRSGNREMLAKQLFAKLNSKQGWLTLGSSGSLGLDRNGDEDAAPALTLTVTDTIGAGDAFFALASLCAARELPIQIGSLLGNLAGAMAANVLGNAEPVTKPRLLKYLGTILNV